MFKNNLLKIFTLLLATLLLINNLYPKQKTTFPFYEIRKDGKLKGFILGSIHFGEKDMYPFNKKIENAFKNSSVVITEVSKEFIIDKNNSEIIRLQKYLIPNNEKITDYMEEDLIKQFDSKLINYGMSLSSIEMYNPSYIEHLINEKIDDGIGINSYYGVESMLLKLDEKKMNRYLETPEEQYNLTFVPHWQVDYRSWVNNLSTREERIDGVKSLMYLYKNGMYDEIVDYGYEAGTNYAEKIVDERNEKWIPQIIDSLENETSTFICVGAMHTLAGEKNLPALLEQEGYSVKMIKN